MRELDNFYLKQDEPIKGTLLALREIILQQDEDVTNAWKYGMPFFCYKGKMFCYLWFHKKHKQPYIGIVEDRSRMKIMLFDSNEDLPLQTIENILQKAINLYKTGEIKIKE